VKSNLSEKGKVYHNQPPISQIRAIYNHTGAYELTGPDTWEVEEL
jgi:hypothetical protein